MSPGLRLRAALLGLLFLGLLVGRLSSVLAPIAAALAPAVCRVCHGCGVGEPGELCDCDACHAVDEGRAARAPSMHEPIHDAVLEHQAASPAPGWAGVFGPLAKPVSAARTLSNPSPRALRPRGLDPPLVPPPDVAS